jgi:hypothetical protein
MQQSAWILRTIEQDMLRQCDKGETVSFRAADPSPVHCLLVQAQQSFHLAQILERNVLKSGRLRDTLWFSCGLPLGTDGSSAMLDPRFLTAWQSPGFDLCLTGATGTGKTCLAPVPLDRWLVAWTSRYALCAYPASLQCYAAPLARAAICASGNFGPIPPSSSWRIGG